MDETTQAVSVLEAFKGLFNGVPIFGKPILMCAKIDLKILVNLEERSDSMLIIHPRTWQG